MYSRSLSRASLGSRGAVNMRLMTAAERPDALWFALRMVQVVLRGSPSASACSSSVTNPTATRASPSCLILAACRAFIAATRVAGLGWVEQIGSGGAESVAQAGSETKNPFSDRPSLFMLTNLDYAAGVNLAQRLITVHTPPARLILL